MVWVIAFGEHFFGDLWCVVWGYGGMRTHFSLLNPQSCILGYAKLIHACCTCATTLANAAHKPVISAS